MMALLDGDTVVVLARGYLDIMLDVWGTALLRYRLARVRTHAVTG